jgi:esterase/lipase superfamily enzyme
MAEGIFAKTNPECSNLVVYGKDKSSFVQKADEFLERIRVKRIEDPKRPLVLIGHSLGGLLLEQALVNAHNNPKYTHIKDATYAPYLSTSKF